MNERYKVKVYKLEKERQEDKDKSAHRKVMIDRPDDPQLLHLMHHFLRTEAL